jgi:hypothetical protein
MKTYKCRFEISTTDSALTNEFNNRYNVRYLYYKDIHSISCIYIRRQLASIVKIVIVAAETASKSMCDYNFLRSKMNCMLQPGNIKTSFSVPRLCLWVCHCGTATVDFLASRAVVTCPQLLWLPRVPSLQH